MKKINKLVKILCLMIVFLFLTIRISSYIEAQRICNLIKAGDTIKTSFSNGSTAPLFLDKIATVIQADGPKIPLVEACWYGNKQAVEVLLNNGADPNFFIKGRWGTMDATVVGGRFSEERFEILQLLVENGADVNAYGSGQESIFTLANMIQDNNDQLEELAIEYLLKHGASGVDEDNYTILHSLAKSNNKIFAEVLIEKFDFDVNAVNKEIGITPLINVVRVEGNTDPVEMVKLFLDNGADKNIADFSGKTAYDYAIRNGYMESAELLK